MSQTGAIVFYVTEEIPNVDAILVRLVAWLGAERLMYANRTKGESNAWELAQKYARDEVPSPYPPKEVVCERCSAEEIQGKYRVGTELKIDFSTSARTDLFCKAHAQLPEGLRGNFNPGSPIVSIGWHDLVDVDPEDEQHLLARPFLTIKVWGYGTPANDAKYREDIWDQAFIKEFANELSGIVNPHHLRRALMFSY